MFSVVIFRFTEMWSQPLYHLPDLHDVVFRHRADDPGLIRVPGEVRDLSCMASMDELVKKRKKTQVLLFVDILCI